MIFYLVVGTVSWICTELLTCQDIDRISSLPVGISNKYDRYASTTDSPTPSHPMNLTVTLEVRDPPGIDEKKYFHVPGIYFGDNTVTEAPGGKIYFRCKEDHELDCNIEAKVEEDWQLTPPSYLFGSSRQSMAGMKSPTTQIDGGDTSCWDESKVSIGASALVGWFPLTEMRRFIESYGYGDLQIGGLSIGANVHARIRLNRVIDLTFACGYIRDSPTFLPNPKELPEASAKWKLDVVHLDFGVKYKPDILTHPQIAIGGSVAFANVEQQSNYGATPFTVEHRLSILPYEASRTSLGLFAGIDWGFTMTRNVDFIFGCRFLKVLNPVTLKVTDTQKDTGGSRYFEMDASRAALSIGIDWRI